MQMQNGADAEWGAAADEIGAQLTHPRKDEGGAL